MMPPLPRLRRLRSAVLSVLILALSLAGAEDAADWVYDRTRPRRG